MTWTDYATWLGSGLSIIAMIVSIWQAFRAKGSADQAEKMRDEISVRSAHNELSNLNGLLGSAIRSMDKYGPGATANARRGCSPDSDAASVRAVTSEMIRLKNLLIETFGQEVDELIKKINDLLKKFAQPKDSTDRDELGYMIHAEIVEFSGNMKKELDSALYR